MFELKVISHFAAAHQLREFEGKCENLHGHNWKVEVYVEGNELSDNGLLLDFRKMKQATDEVLDTLDHQFLNDMEPFKKTNPSSENIARYIFESLAETLDGTSVRVSKVTAWESDTACASYMES